MTGRGNPKPRDLTTGIDVLIVSAGATDLGDLVVALAAAELRVQTAHEAEVVAAAVINGRPELAVVDLRRDDPLSFRLLTWLSRNASCAALVITELSEADTRIRALQLGALDHLVTPFDPREGVARAQALIARRRARHRTRLECGDLTIDVAQRRATRNGEAVPLTPREIDVLVCLVERNEVPVSKRELLAEVWHDEARSENVVEANVSSLRRKLHALGPPVIHTVHRKGYVFRPVPVESTRADVDDVTAGAQRR